MGAQGLSENGTSGLSNLFDCGRIPDLWHIITLKRIFSVY